VAISPGCSAGSGSSAEAARELDVLAQLLPGEGRAGRNAAASLRQRN